MTSEPAGADHAMACLEGATFGQSASSRLSGLWLHGAALSLFSGSAPESALLFASLPVHADGEVWRLTDYEFSGATRPGC